MSMASRISRYRGDTYPRVYAIKSAAGAAIDITGWTFALTVNSEENPTDDASQIAQFSGVIQDAAAGTVAFPFPASIPAGNHYYDIQSVDASGYIRTHEKGVLVITQDINKL